MKIIFLTLLLISYCFAAASLRGQTLPSDSTLSSDSTEIELYPAPQIHSNAYNPNPLEMGRVFARQWFLAGGFPGLTPARIQDNNFIIDPYYAPLDLSFSESEDSRVVLSNSTQFISLDSVKTTIPYTRLHYQFGSYEFFDLFVRHRQRLGNWEFDLSGFNRSGSDGHLNSTGDLVNINAKLRYYDNYSSYFEVDYKVWVNTYRYWPSEGDTTILQTAEDNNSLDNLSFSRGWENSDNGETRLGLQLYWRNGSWSGSDLSNEPFNYKIGRVYFSTIHHYGKSYLNLFASGDYNWGTVRGRSSSLNLFSFQTRLQYGISLGQSLRLNTQIKAAYLDEKTVTSVEVDFILWQRLLVIFGGDKFSLPDIHGTFSDHMAWRGWINVKYQSDRSEQFSYGLGLQSAKYWDLHLYPGQLYPQVADINYFNADLDFRFTIFHLGIDYQYKIEGFEQMPDHLGSFLADMEFNFIGDFRLFASGKILFGQNYTPYRFDLVNNFLLPGTGEIDYSWQLDVKIAARLENFEIYYQGLHLDAFMGNDKDFFWVRGFENDLPRFRIGINWVLYN